jgi:class 3 adenylate cyclase
MPDLPSGTVSFLFTDIEGSTALWERDRAAMREAVERQLTILQSLITAHHGVVFRVIGDAVQAAFASAADALRAAVAAQRALLQETWADPLDRYGCGWRCMREKPRRMGGGTTWRSPSIGSPSSWPSVMAPRSC